MKDFDSKKQLAKYMFLAGLVFAISMLVPMIMTLIIMLAI